MSINFSFNSTQTHLDTWECKMINIWDDGIVGNPLIGLNEYLWGLKYYMDSQGLKTLFDLPLCDENDLH